MIVKKIKDVSTVQIRYSDDASEAVIIFNDSELLGSDEVIPESSHIFKLSKNNEGIWNVLPLIELSYEKRKKKRNE